MNLPKPSDKEDMYLNYLATGQGDLPIPASKKHVYLDYIAKNGSMGGGGVNHTHANKVVLDSINNIDIENIKDIYDIKNDITRIDKLEESTVSTVTTDKDFANVQATSQGYFEDVKLSGKTLVNLGEPSTIYETTSDRIVSNFKNRDTLTSKVVTFINYDSRKMALILYDASTNSYKRTLEVNSGATRIDIPSTEKLINTTCLYSNGWSLADKESLKSKYSILEGDYTQNPPSYFEGLKSVGDGADEIVVSSVNDEPIEIEVTDEKGVTSKVHNPKYKTDKKRILYYDTTDNTWKKPVLREWDTIEKHSDGKYYYHQRSPQLVLNGSENWSKENADLDSTVLFNITVDNSMGVGTTSSIANLLSDKFANVISGTGGTWGTDKEGISINPAKKLHIRILKSRLETQDVAGFKKWLQANNVTVVYQLAQEKVFECTNIDLITYANETNYVFNGGVISPRTSLKVHSNISNVVSLLQKKVSVIEERFLNHVITQNRLQLASTYSTDSVTFKVDYNSKSVSPLDNDLYNLIKKNILVGKDNYDYETMCTMLLDYASWKQITWEQYDELMTLIETQQHPKEEAIK